MMTLNSAFTLIFFLFTVSGFSQKDKVVGTYFKEMGNDSHKIEYTLELKSDQTFKFHSYTNHASGIPQIVHLYGKGTWNMNGKIITLYTDQTKDIDSENTLNFTNSKARFITKSPRDKSSAVIPNGLRFYESDIFWINSLQINMQ